MSLVGTVIGYVLSAFILVLIARMVLDWAGVLGVRRPWVSRARSLTYAGTEPVLRPVRRMLPPLRAGGMGIDLAFTVVFIVAVILRFVAFSL
ncbi:MAG TPA: YggT family protein [Pseudonocardiaceae bacterium]|nr:YggT family protein [Pseudonocardiaceae bacterium]